MSWLRDRLTPKRLALVGVLLAVAIASIVLGDPLAHGGVGAQEGGQRGVGGFPRIAELVAIAVAFVIAWPTGDRDPRSNDEE